MSQELKVTDLSALLKVKEGEVVQLPPFNGDVPFIARVKQPSLVKLIAGGAFPNELLSLAHAIFEGDEKPMQKEMKTVKGLDKVYKTMEVLAENALVEPSYAELKEAGIELTDLQLSALMAYCQKGVKVLEYFRTE